MSRDIAEAANRLLRADYEELKTIVRLDPDMIRAVGASLLSSKIEAISYIQSAYDELCVKFSGVHSDDEMDSVLLRLHAGLKKLGSPPVSQTHSACPHVTPPTNLSEPCQICGALGPWFDSGDCVTSNNRTSE